MTEPDANTKLEARTLAAWARKHRPAIAEGVHGFTIVCNNCGSMDGTVGLWTMRDDYGYYLRCTNAECEQKIQY